MTIKDVLTKKLFMVGGALLVLMALAVPSVYFYLQYRQAQSELANPTAAGQAKAARIIQAVGKLMALPTDETPTVAAVTDSQKLPNQPFFANAKNGDVVLLYINAKKAILYRPERNQIIDIAPINSQSTPSASLTAPTSEVTPIAASDSTKIALRNGTKILGLTKTYETTLSTKLPGVMVVDRDNAASSDYTKTVLYDLTGTKSGDASILATKLNITVGQLSKNEDISTIKDKADFLIILGTDQK
ncbi:LytR C-terminal domain-containing protein [Candidatus Gottesmanbacteria bacterium]|nr:LytR C-terminal domain-containing protein [Candidatus Gottesmanbacteria bacterium]